MPWQGDRPTNLADHLSADPISPELEAERSVLLCLRAMDKGGGPPGYAAQAQYSTTGGGAVPVMHAHAPPPAAAPSCTPSPALHDGSD